jgi:DNA-directed RNA polymerase specialized sigma subunit
MTKEPDNLYTVNNANYEMLSHEESHQLLVELRELENKLPNSSVVEAKKINRMQDRIREKLIISHMGIIKNVAFKFWDGYETPTETDGLRAELVSAGVLGFMQALPNYFNQPVEKFSSWIYFGIRKQIWLHLGTRFKQCSKQAPYLLESLSKVVTCALQLREENGVDPTIREVARAMYISPELVEIVLRFNVGFTSGDKDLSDGDSDESFSLFDTLSDTTDADIHGRPSHTTSYGDRHCLSEKLMELPQLQSSVLLLRSGYSEAYECSINDIIAEYKNPESRVRSLKDELTKSAEDKPAILNSINIFFDNLSADRPSEELLEKLNIKES